jgi:hypothetical protein
LLLTHITMADDEKNLEKAQKDQRDIGIGAEEDPHSTGPAENLREEAAEMVDQDDKSRDSMSPQNKAEHEPTVVRDLDNPEIVEKRKSVTGILAGRPIVILLIIGAIVLGGFLLYTQIQYSNQAYKIENFNALWNQSLADLRSGNTSIDEYCTNRVHDEDLCNRFKNLQYMG